MSGHPPTLGAVLAGGLATRMGGGDKTLLGIGGRSILARIAERLGPQCEGLVINANGDAGRFAFLSRPVVADSLEGHAGPLAGLIAVLDWAAENRPEIGWVATTAGDTPFLPRDLVGRLHAAHGDAPVALAASGQIHPVAGLWAVSLREDLRAALARGERAMHRWAGAHAPGIATWPAEPFDPFFNANSPADIAEAERIAEAYPQA